MSAKTNPKKRKIDEISKSESEEEEKESFKHLNPSKRIKKNEMPEEEEQKGPSNNS